MTMFSALSSRAGLTQTEAARMLDARLDSVKSWWSGRRNPSDGVIAELTKLNQEIERAAQSLYDGWIKKGRPNQIAVQLSSEWPGEKTAYAVVAALKCKVSKGVKIAIKNPT